MPEWGGPEVWMLWLGIPVDFEHDVVGVVGEGPEVVDAEFGLFEGLEWPLAICQAWAGSVPVGNL